MKFYCILLDAFPLKDEIIEFGKKHNFKLVKQFTTGIYTIPTMFSMLHGKPPSELIKNGISYFGPEKDSDNFFKFNSNNNNLIKILNQKKYNIYMDNFYAYLKIITGLKHYENNNTIKLSDIKKEKNIMFKNVLYPSEYENLNILSTNYNSNFIWPYQHYHDEEQTDKFYSEIINNIKFVQQEKNNDTFYILTLQHYHHISRILKEKKIDEKLLVKKILSKIINLLEQINFNEPNSLFYIFADHGLGGNQLFDLENYYTWALIKDNTRIENKEIKPFISTCDFYNLILNKINYKLNHNFSHNIYDKFDKERIYYLEDSRMYSSPINMNSMGVVKIIDYHNNRPNIILQITYLKGLCDTIQKYFIYEYKLQHNKNYLFNYNFDKKLIFEGKLDYNIIKSLNYSQEIKVLFNEINNKYNLNKTLDKIKDKKLNYIKNYIKNNYQEPNQYKIVIDNKTVYRYDVRDNTDYFKKILPYIQKYNDTNNNY